MPTLQQIISAEFGFEAIKELLFKLYTHPNVESVLNPVRGFVDSLSPIVWGVILLLIGAAFACFGKRFLLGIAIFAGIPAVAYAGGAAFVTPRLNALIGSFLTLDPVIVGIVFAVIGAVLFLPIYYVGVAVVGGYATYLLVYPFAAALFGAKIAMLTGLGFAVAVVVILFIFLKWFEMAGTSIAGAYVLMLGINSIVLLPAVANYVIWAVVALVGFIIQIKTRKRY